MLTEEIATEGGVEKHETGRYGQPTKAPLASTVLKDLGEEVQSGPGWHSFHCPDSDKHEHDDKHKSAACSDELGSLVCYSPGCLDGRHIGVPEFVSRNCDALRDAPYVAEMIKNFEAVPSEGLPPEQLPTLPGLGTDFAELDERRDFGYPDNGRTSRTKLSRADSAELRSEGLVPSDTVKRSEYRRLCRRRMGAGDRSIALATPTSTRHIADPSTGTTAELLLEVGATPPWMSASKKAQAFGC